MSKGPIEKLLELAEQRMDCRLSVEFRVGHDDCEPIMCVLVAHGADGSVDLVSSVAETADMAAKRVLEQFDGTDEESAKRILDQLNATPED